MKRFNDEIQNPSITSTWLNSRTDESTTKVYAVWFNIRLRYAVMMYGMYADTDAAGDKNTATFRPALGQTFYNK